MTDVLRCSFCNKSQKDVKKLIAGPTVFICDECVDVCVDILTEEGIPSGGPGKKALAFVKDAESHIITAETLVGSPDSAGAVRQIRAGAIAGLRALCVLTEANDANTWSETKVIVTALQNHPEVATPLQETDISHLILRVSTEGAKFTQPAVAASLEAAKALVAFARAEAGKAIRPRERSAPN